MFLLRLPFEKLNSRRRGISSVAKLRCWWNFLFLGDDGFDSGLAWVSIPCRWCIGDCLPFLRCIGPVRVAVVERRCGFRNFFVYKSKWKIGIVNSSCIIIDFAQILLGFSMREDVRLEICWLGEFLVAAIKGTYVRSVASVNANVSAVDWNLELNNVWM